jgi:probable dihydroxyacetone kinase regulator
MSDSSITKQALANSMKKLMEEKPLSKINIEDIVKQCNLSRKSFYYHFKDKYNLVNWIFYTEFVSNLQNNPDMGWNLFEDICIFFYENKTFYRNALEVRGQNSFYDYFGEILSSIIELHFKSILGKYDTSNFYVVFITDAIRISISRWLLEGAQIPPKEYVALTKSVVTGLAKYIIEEMDDR